MAEGLLRAFHGRKFTAYSAGTHPRSVNPWAVEAMRELGIDLSEHRSQHVDAFAEIPMDYVVTVCNSARESCPYAPAMERNIHHAFADPSMVRGADEEKLAAFRGARDDIRRWLKDTFG